MQNAKPRPFVPSHKFTPWRADFKRGLLLMLAGVGVASLVLLPLPKEVRVLSAAAALLLGWIGSIRWSRGMSRYHGKRVETRAVRSLRRALHSSIALRESVMLPTGGDADVVVDFDPRWVIEIKSHRAVRVQRKTFGSDVILHTQNRPLQKAGAFLAQTKRNAAALHGQPVLWFPRAHTKTCGAVDGVKVVTGPAAWLVKQCALRKAGWF
ncbi:MAG: hypothetical protein PHO55_08760 [Thiomonas arsenitoxydans]|jgi:hypothetical protein|nr:hypothetical protein [Thiomonas arsenitoxydans]